MCDSVEIGKMRQNMAVLLRRAATDEEFRTLCLRDASKACFELTGKTMPEQYAVRFYETEQEVSDDHKARWVRLPLFYSKTWR